MSKLSFAATDERRCSCCGAYLRWHDDSYLGEGGWVENEWAECMNPLCQLNKQKELNRLACHE